jgi:hypothetical protein
VSDIPQWAHLALASLIMQIGPNEGRIEMVDSLLNETDVLGEALGGIRHLGEEADDTYVGGFEDGLTAAGLAEDAHEPDEKMRRMTREDFEEVGHRLELALKTVSEASQSIIRSRWDGFTRFCQTNGVDARAVALAWGSDVLERFEGIEEDIDARISDRTFEQLSDAHWEAFESALYAVWKDEGANGEPAS